MRLDHGPPPIVTAPIAGLDSEIRELLPISLKKGERNATRSLIAGAFHQAKRSTIACLGAFPPSVLIPM